MRVHRIPVVEILLVACIVAVLAGMVAVFRSGPRESARQTEALNNLSVLGHYFSARAARSEGRFTGFDYDGKRFTLAPLVLGDIDLRQPGNLKIFFSPGDEELTFEGTDAAQWAAIDAERLRTGDYSAFTSWAGRRNRDPRFALAGAGNAAGALLLCDDDQGPLHHPSGLMVCWISGKAEFLTWDELGIPEPEADAPFLGDRASVDRLRAMASCGAGR